MPVNEKQISGETIYQRQQYMKGGLGRRYWDYRDNVALSVLDEADMVIVDLGCGEGITLEKMVARFKAGSIVGVDVIPENVAICLDHNLPVRQGNLYDLDLADGSVDAVTLMEVIEHLERPEAAVRQIHRILKPGGKLVIVFPNDAIVKVARLLTLKFKEAAYDPGHTRQWTPGDMRLLLNGAGFTVFFSKSIPFRWYPISLHCVVAARKLAP